MPTLSSSSPSASSRRVFAAYRRLFRARKILFQGDSTALTQSRTAIRNEFEKNRHLIVTTPATTTPNGGNEVFEAAIAAADEATDMMLHGIIQGKLNEGSGHYGTSVENHHLKKS